MLNGTMQTSRRWRSTPTFRMGALAAGVLIVLAGIGLSADRRQSGGSARQSNNASRNAGANKNNNYNRNTNVDRNTNTNVNRNTNTNVNRNTNVNVNRNVNVNTGYGAPRGAVAVGEEGAVAVGRRGAVAVGEEGYAGVGRYGAVVGGERYESYEGWRTAAGVATGIAIGTMLARPPTTSVTVVTGGTNYMYADGAYYEQVMYAGEMSYRVVAPPAGAIITTLPGGCTTTVMGGVSVQQCGPTYYKRVSNGYQVVVF
jgi:Family of unknown function (DUF6515)